MEESSKHSRKRRRDTLACEPCRKKKIKCDRQHPCGSCAQARDETCFYAPSKTPSKAPFRAEDTRFSTFGSSGAQLKGPPHAESAGASPSISITGSDAATSNILQSRIADLEQRLAKFEKNQDLPAETTPAAIPVSSAPIRGVFDKTRFYGQTHWMNLVSEFPDVVDAFMFTAVERDSARATLLRECKMLARTVKMREAQLAPVVVNVEESIPHRMVCQLLVSYYFRCVESAVRVLHFPTFWGKCEDFWSTGTAPSYSFILQLALVLAIGRNFVEESQEIPGRLTAMQWINVAQSWLGPISEKGRMDLEGLRVYCLVLLARQVNSVSGDLIWISTGNLLRMAMHMGLHIDPLQNPKARSSALEVESRRRLWATILELTVQCSFGVGGQPLITHENYTTEYPTNVEDAEITVGFRAASTSAYTGTSVQVALMQSMPIRLEIANLLNNVCTAPSYETVQRLSTSLTASLKRARSFLSSLTPVSQEQLPISEAMYTCFTQRALFDLYYPFAVKAKKQSEYLHARRACLNASLAITNAMSEPTTANFVLHEDGVLADLYAQSTLYIADEAIYRLQSAAEDNLLGLTGDVLGVKELRQHIQDATVWWGGRIRLYHTNVKGYLASGMLLAQIDAMMRGEDVTEAIAQSAQARLLEAKGWLTERVERFDSATASISSSLDMISDLPTLEEDWFGWDERFEFQFM